MIKKRLINGITIYLLNNIETENIYISLIVNKGSLIEESYKGSCHFIEHLNTTFDKFKKSNNKIVRTVGITDFNKIEYIIIVNKIEDIISVLMNIKNIIKGKYLNIDYMEEVRQDIIKEFNLKTNSKEYNETKLLFKNSKYENYYSIGNLNDIEQIGLEDIVNFFHHKFCLNNYAISIIGKYNSINISRYIDKMFSYIQLKKTKGFLYHKSINYPIIPVYNNHIYKYQSNKERKKVRVYIRINKCLNYEYVENMVLADIFIEILYCKLKQELNEMSYLSLDYAKSNFINYHFYNFDIEFKNKVNIDKIKDLFITILVDTKKRFIDKELFDIYILTYQKYMEDNNKSLESAYRKVVNDFLYNIDFESSMIWFQNNIKTKGLEYYKIKIDEWVENNNMLFIEY